MREKWETIDRKSKTDLIMDISSIWYSTFYKWLGGGGVIFQSQIWKIWKLAWNYNVLCLTTLMWYCFKHFCPYVRDLLLKFWEIYQKCLVNLCARTTFFLQVLLVEQGLTVFWFCVYQFVWDKFCQNPNSTTTQLNLTYP